MVYWIVFLCLRLAVACNTSSCLAYQWGYPIWHMANLRYLTMVALTPPGGNKGMNVLQLRRAFRLRERLVLCNAFLCGGYHSFWEPAPVVAPNIDSIYGAAWLDIQSSWKLYLPPLTDNRYTSIHFLDMYNNIVGKSDISARKKGGIWCIYQNTKEPQCGEDVVANISVPQYTFLIARIYSEGKEASCGNNGCEWLEKVTFESVEKSTPDTLDVKKEYKSLMGRNGCPYVYGDPPCGSGKVDDFWKAICKVLEESPLDPNSVEGQYVKKNFGPFGIYPDHCEKKLDFRRLRKGFHQGSKYISDTITTSPTMKDNWVFLVFNGTWGSDFFTRCQTSIRLHDMSPNEKAAYWTAFTDSKGEVLQGEDFDYLVTFNQSALIPIDANHNGFWSLTLYDKTYYLHPNLKRLYAIRGRNQTPPGDIYVSTQCRKFRQENKFCLDAPSEEFNLILRGYMPLNSLGWGGNYSLPIISRLDKSRRQTPPDPECPVIIYLVLILVAFAIVR